MYFTLRESLLEAIDDRLRLNANQVHAILQTQDTSLDLTQSANTDVLLENLEDQNITLIIFSPDGEPAFTYGYDTPLQHNFIDLLNHPKGIIANRTDPTEADDTLRVYTAPIEFNGQLIAYIELTHTLENLEDTLDRLLLLLEIGIPLFSVGAGLGGYVLVARALNRIDRITDTARRISSDDLSTRLQMSEVDDEVGRLSKTFDMMLDRLEESFQRERQFSHDAAHELRTPLTAMRTILDTTRTKRRPVEHYEEALDDLTDEVNRLQRLVDDLLNLVRQQSPASLSLETINLSTLLNDLCDSLATLAEAKSLTLTCDIPEDLNILADYDQIIRLFFNLIDNAIKYTDNGKVQIKAEETTSDTLNIIIADTGNGITPEHILLIFDRFFQVEASRAVQGSGLGLSIAKQIAEAHHGQITVSSTVGKGTQFTVQFPKSPPP